MKGSKGFVLAGLLVFLPILSSGLALAYGGTLLFSLHDRSQHSCRRSLMEQSSLVRDRWMALESLNPQARALRADHESAQRGMKLAVLSGNPKVIAAARLRLAKVQARQILLQQRQQNLLLQLRRQITIGERTVLEEATKLKSWAKNLTRPALSLPFIAEPATSPTPEYLLQGAQHQLRWVIDLESIVPSSLRHLGMPRPTWKSECSVRWQRQEEKWQVRLSAGRPSLKW